MALWLWLAASFFVLVPQAPPQPRPAALEQPAGSKVWIGRYGEFEEFLRTAQIERTQATPVGVTSPRHAFFAPGGLANGAAIKRLPPGRIDGFFESYKSEIAAYKLDRLLQLDMVPPTIERRLNGEPVSVQLWVENTRMWKEIKDTSERSPDFAEWTRQLPRVQVFDDLVGNIDENAGNLLIDRQWNLIKIDHSRAFTGTPTLPFPIERIRQIDQPFFDRIKALDRETVKRELGHLLTDNAALPGFFSRRDSIVRGFEQLAKRLGPDKVFEPWPGQ